MSFSIKHRIPSYVLLVLLIGIIIYATVFLVDHFSSSDYKIAFVIISILGLTMVALDMMRINAYGAGFKACSCDSSSSQPSLLSAVSEARQNPVGMLSSIAQSAVSKALTPSEAPPPQQSPAAPQQALPPPPRPAPQQPPAATPPPPRQAPAPPTSPVPQQAPPPPRQASAPAPPPQQPPAAAPRSSVGFSLGEKLKEMEDLTRKAALDTINHAAEDTKQQVLGSVSTNY
jgi:hypothetical protein